MKLFGCIWSNKPLRLTILRRRGSPFTILVGAPVFGVIYTSEAAAFQKFFIYRIPLDVAKALYLTAIRNKKETRVSVKSLSSPLEYRCG
jgi:hypothetical protein